MTGLVLAFSVVAGFHTSLAATDLSPPTRKLCGSRLLAQYPQQFALPHLPVGAGKATGARAAASTSQQPQIIVGTQLEFPVAGSGQLVLATARYVGDHVFVFVEDSEWDTNGGSILQSHVDVAGELFDRATPADPGRGIFETSEETFGPAPDVDGYPQIFLFILDIPDSRLVGFFDARVADHEVPELRRDMLYIDGFFLRQQSYLARGTIAHELQHLIHWGHDDDEKAWLDEGLSGYAEELNGYPEADGAVVPAFLERPDSGLTKWSNRPDNYGSTYLFTSFLAERHGRDLIRTLVSEPRNGSGGIDAAFATLDIDEDFAGAWSKWIAANYASEDVALTYTALHGRRVFSFVVNNLPLEVSGGFVAEQWGTTYVLFRTPGSLLVEFAGGEAARFHVWAYLMRAGVGELRRIELDDENRGRVTAADIDSLALIVGKTTHGGRDFEISARRLIPTAVAPSQSLSAAGALSLGAGFPNPFNHSVTIPVAGPLVEIGIYNVAGQKVRTLAPPHGAELQILWDGRDAGGGELAGGLYVVEARSFSARSSTTVMLLK